MERARYGILISYIGTQFCGWQRQPALQSGKHSIQAEIEEALQKITQTKVNVVASGRTDSGVHALGQVAHFDLQTKRGWQPEILAKGLNSQLPLSVRILECQKLNSEFHAILTADRKQYSYYYQQGEVSLPHLTPVVRWIHDSLDVVAMNQAIQEIVGEHDFKPFQASGGGAKTTRRVIYEAEVVRQNLQFPGGFLLGQGGALIRIRIVGSGFLKQMVRGISGTLLEIGLGSKPVHRLKEIIQCQERSMVGATAPARGLWLERVNYPKSVLEWRHALS